MRYTGSVLFVLPRLDVGGSELHVVALAQAVVAAGGRATIVCLRSEGSLASSAREVGAEVIVLGLAGVADPRAAWALGRLLIRIGPDVVHSCLFGFDGLVSLPARLLGVPLVLTTRRELAGWMRPRHRVARAVSKLTSDRVVCCAEAVRQLVLRDEGPIDPQRVLTLLNGVDLARFRAGRERRQQIRADLSLTDAQPLVTTVANLAPEKGHASLLTALPAVLEQHPGAVFAWAGEGPLKAGLERSVTSARLLAQVRLLGRCDDVAGLLGASDLFVLPSLSEGLPNALLEAMAAGLPCVASAVGGVPELAGRAGAVRLVPAGEPDRLAAAVCSLLGSREAADRLAEAGRLRAGAFELGGSQERYLRLYAGVRPGTPHTEPTPEPTVR